MNPRANSPSFCISPLCNKILSFVFYRPAVESRSGPGGLGWQNKLMQVEGECECNCCWWEQATHGRPIRELLNAQSSGSSPPGFHFASPFFSPGADAKKVHYFETASGFFRVMQCEEHVALVSLPSWLCNSGGHIRIYQPIRTNQETVCWE